MMSRDRLRLIGSKVFGTDCYVTCTMNHSAACRMKGRTSWIEEIKTLVHFTFFSEVIGLYMVNTFLYDNLEVMPSQ